MWKRFYIVFLVYFLCFTSSPFCFAQKTENSATLSRINSQLPENIILKIRDLEYKLPKTEVNRWLSESTRLTISPSYLSEIENINFCKYKKSIACELGFSWRFSNHVRKQADLKIDRDKINDYVFKLAGKFDHNPEDAKLKIENGKVSVFSLSAKGLELDQEKSAESLLNYIESAEYGQPALLSYKEIDPQLPDIDSIDDLGINNLIGEGRSNFRGSPKNRIFNIKVATDRFNGVLIKPGEEFSFVKVLGEVDGEHGYLPELVIKKDKTEPEFGGGICQVSTTAFRAALKSGLKITARTNHAYPVQYYNPQGMDATVYVPRPDLRFTNNTPGYILIQTKIEGTELIFDFYGTDDGRKTELIGPKVLERNPDGSMKTTLTQQVSDKNGNLVREDVFKSSYDSPSKYPHPGSSTDVLTQKPKGWSDNEWSKYKKQHGL